MVLLKIMFPYYNTIPYFTWTHTHHLSILRTSCITTAHWSRWRRIHLGGHEMRNFTAWLATRHNPITAHINSSVELCRWSDLSHQPCLPDCELPSQHQHTEISRVLLRDKIILAEFGPNLNKHFKMPGQPMKQMKTMSCSQWLNQTCDSFKTHWDCYYMT